MKNFKKILSVFTVLLLSTVFFYACEEEAAEKAKSEIVFSFGKKTIDANLEKAAAGGSEAEIARAIVLTIIDSEGNVKHNLKKLDLFYIDGAYLTEGLELEVGNYEIADFFVVDGEKNIIYMTPKTGSNFADYVATPLKHGFTITEDVHNQVNIDVMRTDCFTCSAVDFGYSETFKFNVVDCPGIKGLNVISGNGANLYDKLGLKVQLTDVTIKTEGTAVLSFENDKITVVETGTLTGLAFYKGEELVEYFTFMDIYDVKNVGAYKYFILWKNKPDSFEYKRPKNNIYNKYYKALLGGWFTHFENVHYNNNFSDISKIAPHDTLEQNLQIQGIFEGGMGGHTVWHETIKGKGIYNTNTILSAGRFSSNPDAYRIPLRLSYFLQISWGYKTSIRNFKIRMRIANKTVPIPLNWSKLDANGNPTEDFYGRKF